MRSEDLPTTAHENYDTKTKLNDNNILPTHIVQLSGHRNVQSVNNYSAVSNEQQENMSDSEWKYYKYSMEKKAIVEFTKLEWPPSAVNLHS